MAPGTVPYTPLMEAIHDQSNGERLQRVLAAAGVGPRRACERMIEAKVTAAGAREGVDVLDGALFRATVGSFELTLPPRSVRMLELRA